jgi:hypothetical protein
MNAHASGKVLTMLSVSLLEQRFPHIVQGLVASWFDLDLTDHFLDTVLVDVRDGRQGLPEEAFAELMFLSDLNWKRRHFNEEGVQVSADDFSFGGPPS